MNNQIKINRIARALGINFTVAGFKMLKSSYDNLKPVKFPSRFVNDSFNKIKNIPISQRDFHYYFTDWSNLKKMTIIIYRIIKNFKWERDRFDCDDRSKLVSALFSLLFGLNSCGEVYCKITSLKTGRTGRHWTNVIITSSGEVYLFDVDNFGLTMKLYPNKPISMGKWSYEFISARIS